MKLSERQERFCQEYTVTGNGSKAALAAGYSPKGITVQATRLLANDSIRARIDEIQRPRLDELDATGKRTLAEIARIAYAATEEGGAVKVSDKIRALDILAKIQGLYDQQKAEGQTVNITIIEPKVEPPVVRVQE